MYTVLKRRENELIVLSAVATSITRMVIYLSDVKERYNPNLDYERKYLLRLKALTLRFAHRLLVLVTNGIYWSMLEAGSSLIAANIVVLYGLVVKKTFKRYFRRYQNVFSLRSGASPPCPSDIERGYRRSDEKQIWQGTAVGIASFAGIATAASLEDQSDMDLNDIHITRTLQRTEDRA